MHGMLKEELEILKLLENYPCLKEEQIIKYYDNSKTGIYLNFLQSKGLIVKKDGLALLRGSPENADFLKAFEVLLYYKAEINNHWPVGYPFTIYFMRNNMHYDIAVAKAGDEESLSAVINRSASQKVIIVIEDVEQINLLPVEKPVLYFIPGEPPRLYSKLPDRED